MSPLVTLSTSPPLDRATCSVRGDVTVSTLSCFPAAEVQACVLQQIAIFTQFEPSCVIQDAIAPALDLAPLAMQGTRSTMPGAVAILSALGVSLSTAFSIGSLTLTYFAIPALLLPADAPLMPPLELVAERRARHFRTEKVPKQPADSGIGDEQESILDHGAVTKPKCGIKPQSSESQLLRQWFHLFAKGMHTFPPMAVSGALCYAACAAIIPGPLLQTADKVLLGKRCLYAASTFLSAGIMVFTLTVMKPTNAALHARVIGLMHAEEDGTVAQREEGEAEKTELLIRQWGKVNAQRSTLPVMAAVVATIALAL